MINILDLGYGNSASIYITLQELQISSQIVKKPKELESGTLIIPGVGSIGMFKKKVDDGNWNKNIRDYLNTGNQILGICLGFQALTSFSEESNGIRCINLLKKNILTKKLHKTSNQSNTGWDQINISKNYLEKNGWIPQISKSKKDRIAGRVFYNHQYGVSFNNKSSIQINNLPEFSAMITQHNVMGVQFHPEKSQSFGKNFFEFVL